MKETRKFKFENLLIEFHKFLTKSKIKEEEMRILREEMEMEMKKEDELLHEEIYDILT